MRTDRKSRVTFVFSNPNCSSCACFSVIVFLPSFVLMSFLYLQTH